MSWSLGRDVPIGEKHPAKAVVSAFPGARQIRGASVAEEKSHGDIDEIKRGFESGAGHELSAKRGSAINRRARVKSVHLPEQSIRATQRTLELWQWGQRIGRAGGVAG